METRLFAPDRPEPRAGRRPRVSRRLGALGLALAAALASSLAGQQLEPTQDAAVVQTAEPAVDSSGDAPARPPHPAGQRPEGRDGYSKEAMLERWNLLSPEEKERMQARYRALQKVEPGRRAEILSEAQRLKRLEERIQADLSEEERQTLESLNGPLRRQLIREMVFEEAREEGRSLIDKLEPSQRELFRSATPEQRALYMSRLRLQQEKRLGSALRRLAEELGLALERVDALRDMPLEERHDALLELIKQGITERIEAQGLRGDIPDGAWRRLQTMDPGDFIHVMKRLRLKYPQLWPEGAQGDSALDWPGTGATGPGAGAGPDSRAALESLARHRLIDALRPRAADRLKFARMTPAEREAALAEQGRRAALGVLENLEALEPRRLEDLRRLSTRDFFERIREHFRLPQRLGPWGNGRVRSEREPDSDSRGDSRQDSSGFVPPGARGPIHGPGEKLS